MNTTLAPKEALIVRLAVGLVFGLALGWLFNALTPDHPKAWLQVATSVLLLGAFVIWAGAGAMRRLSLAIWSAVALSLIGLIAWNRIAHTPGFDDNPFFFNLSFLIYPFLFIAHELVSSGDQAGKPVAPYPLYFDQAWKHGVQLALAIVFTGLFWAILGLGALLLGFIGFDWFRHLIENKYFAFPASGMAIAASVHLGDVNTKLMQNFRALVLGVLSWLLPVIAVIGVIFAVSLCFSGLQPLWNTKAATASLLAACVALVLLINAAYQQGDEERDIHVVMKWAVRLACVLVAVFAALAAYSLGLRIAQYGLTPERVMAAVGVVIAVLFGIGYPVAAVWPKGRWLHRIETVNVTLAFVKVAVFLAVLTPLADPLRLSVDSQVARLTSGVVDSDHFDWNLLRFQTGTYGTEALTHLAKSGKTNAIRKAAATAAARKDDERWQTPAAEPPAKPNPVQFHMVQPGAALPVSFLAQAFTAADNTPDCLKAGTVCQAALLDLNDDGKPELLLLDNHYLSVFAEGADGIWSQHGNIIFLTDDDIHAFEAGKVEVRRPAWNDVKVGDNVQSLR